MATLQKIRNRAGVLVAVVIGFSLLAFILGDFLNSGQAFFGKSRFDIAEIGGKTIPYQEYQQKVDETVEINKILTGRSSLDEATTERIREQSWQQMLRDHILKDQYKELGIGVHPNEFYDMVQGNNIHPIIKQLFTDPKTGQFNSSAVIRFLKSIDQDPSGNQKAYWLYLEKTISEERLYAKYTNLIKKGLYVPLEVAKNEYNENARIAKIRFIAKRYTTIADSLIPVSDAEAKKYYEKHKENYKQEESRDLEYVVFEVQPSSEDQKAAEKWINEVKAEFEATKEAIQYVNLNSDAKFDDRFYTKENLDTEIADFMFENEEGATYGPYLKDNTYKLAKLNKIDMLPDSVKARHILIQPGKGMDYPQAKAFADSIKKLIEGGANFASLATLHSSDKGSAIKGGDLGWFREGQMVKPFNDACFFGKEKEIQMVETNFGFHIIQVQAKGKKTKKVQLAIIEREIVPSTRTYQDIYGKASAFAGKNNNYEAFVKAANEEGVPLRTAPYLRKATKTVAGLDNPREMVRWAFKAEKSDMSQVFEFGDKFVIAVLTDIKEKGYQPMESIKNRLIVEVKKQKKADLIEKEIKEKKAPDFNTLASQMGLEILQQDNIRFSSFSVPGAGIEPKLIAAAAVLEKGKMSDPIKGNEGVYVIMVENTEKEEVTNYDPEKIKLMNSFQSRADYEPYEALKKEANIVDERAKFF